MLIVTKEINIRLEKVILEMLNDVSIYISFKTYILTCSIIVSFLHPLHKKQKYSAYSIQYLYVSFVVLILKLRIYGCQNKI